MSEQQGQGAAQPFDLIVIGAGPGGYVAAIRAAQLGLKVACVEKESALGGTCLRVGCIPSKALLESSERYEETLHHLAVHGVDVSGVELNLSKMLGRKDKVVKALTGGIQLLFKKNQVARFEGHGRLVSATEVHVSGAKGEARLTAPRVLIATGSVPSSLPGVAWDGDRVGGSTEALSYPEVPGHLVVIGAGVIGLELGSVWRRLGAKVTVLEYMSTALPGMDDDLSAEAVRLFKKQGIDFKFGVKVTGARAEGDGCVVEVEGGAPISCDRVLVSVGRRPCTEGLGLEELGVAVDRRGVIQVNDHFETSVPGVFAIGDVIPGPMLAHKAEEEGVACVERMVTGYGHVNYDVIPSIVYTHPEVAFVGKTEAQLKAAGVPYKLGKFPFIANGRARALEATDGFVKVLAHAETDRLLGVHIIGAHAGDLIAEAAVSMDFGASAEDVARSCHAHPTLAELLKEAALAVDGRAIHI
ncbi:MAG: dihydrolipoyl dehydrogenase [Deltaproteobacteria bacterium]|nr:dihydrolipoyl dehydrogenase [Deltaproteobacteria bacterium]